MALSPSSFCKRYRGTSEPMADTKTESTESEDEDTDSKDEETAPKARRRALEQARDIMPSTYDVGQGSRSTPDQQLEIAGRASLAPSSVRTPTSPEWSLNSPSVSPVIPSPVASPAPTTTLDKDVLLEIRAQLELYGSVLHTHRDWDYHWCLMATDLALEAWARYTDAQRGALWQAIYEDRREIYDLRRQHSTDQREMQELKDHITRLEQRVDRRGE
ncbi:hypothetical protein Tco_1187905 [Tanacetum coccineum]